MFGLMGVQIPGHKQAPDQQLLLELACQYRFLQIFTQGCCVNHLGGGLAQGRADCAGLFDSGLPLFVQIDDLNKGKVVLSDLVNNKSHTLCLLGADDCFLHLFQRVQHRLELFAIGLRILIIRLDHDVFSRQSHIEHLFLKVADQVGIAGDPAIFTKSVECAAQTQIRGSRHHDQQRDHRCKSKVKLSV